MDLKSINIKSKISETLDSVKNKFKGKSFNGGTVRDIMTSLPDVFKKKKQSDFKTVISIDVNKSLIHICYMTGENKNTFVHERYQYRTSAFSTEFYTELARVIDKYSEKHPDSQTADISLILPDSLVATDTLSLPTMRRSKAFQALDLKLQDLYKNRPDLKIIKYPLLQNKQYSTYSLTMINSKTLSSFYSTLATCKMTPQTVTFASATATNAVQSFNQKLRSLSYILLDIKEDYSVFVFVNRGRTSGFYSLPFGYTVLQKNRLASEDMLFDHSEAELIVLNAEEKAKAKQLTMGVGDNSSAQMLANENGDENYYESELTSETGIKTLAKKTPRKLPKFMLRPAPSGEKEYIYENFRIFIKWALNLVAQNKILFSEQPKTIYVNLPKDYSYVCDMANSESEENGIEFQTLAVGNASDEITRNLELFGGFIDNSANKSNVI